MERSWRIPIWPSIYLSFDSPICVGKSSRKRKDQIKYIAVDCGKVINPLLVDGLTEGESSRRGNLFEMIYDEKPAPHRQLDELRRVPRICRA
jgi:hypothetical protein